MAIGGSDLGDEVIAGERTGDHRCSDDVPREFVVAEEVIARVGSAFATDKEADGYREKKVGGEDDDLPGSQLDARYGHSPRF